MLDDEISVGDGVDAVPRDRREAEQPGDELAVDRVGHASQCAAAQRHDVGSLVSVQEALGVAGEHLDVRQAIVGE